MPRSLEMPPWEPIGDHPDAEIEIRYTWDGTSYRLNAKGQFEIKPVGKKDEFSFCDYPSWNDPDPLRPQEFELVGKLSADEKTKTIYTVTELSTRKRVQLKKGIPLDMQSILSAQESVKAPSWAQITTGKDWVEFWWTPQEPTTKEKNV